MKKNSLCLANALFAVLLYQERKMNQLFDASTCSALPK